MLSRIVSPLWRHHVIRGTDTKTKTTACRCSVRRSREKVDVLAACLALQSEYFHLLLRGTSVSLPDRFSHVIRVVYVVFICLLWLKCFVIERIEVSPHDVWVYFGEREKRCVCISVHVVFCKTILAFPSCSRTQKNSRKLEDRLVFILFNSTPPHLPLSSPLLHLENYVFSG